MNDRYSKLAFLHRVKERKTPSLSTQASFAPFSLKVAWSGKSLIIGRGGRGRGKTFGKVLAFKQHFARPVFNIG